MKSERPWTIRLERQAHRDAVRRLRQAYALLWQMPRPSARPATWDKPVKKTELTVQEVHP